MYIETDPELLSDPLFAELDRIIQLLEESPQILREKNPNFEHGLNMSQVNTMTQHAGLGSSPVFGVELGGSRGGRWGGCPALGSGRRASFCIENNEI